MLVDAASLADRILLEIRTEQDTHLKHMEELSAQVKMDNDHDHTDTRQLIELRHQLTANQIQKLKLQLDTKSTDTWQLIELCHQITAHQIQQLQLQLDTESHTLALA